MKWNLTPTEPTPEMLSAAELALKHSGSHEEGAEAAYKAVLSAAPDPLADAELVERVARRLLRERHPCDSIVYEIMTQNIDGQADEMRYLARDIIRLMKGE